MGIIGNAMGSALGGGLVMAGAQYDQNQAAEERMANSAALTRERLDHMRETTNMRLDARVAEVAAKYAAKEGGGSGSALSGMLNSEIAAAGGVGAATGTSFKPTDRAAFTKDAPLMIPNDDEGNPLPASGLKEFDGKGYAAAEDERTRKVQETILLLSKDPSNLKGFREGQGQEIVNLVTEYAIQNPKASVAELADRVALQKPGTDRVKVSGGTAYNVFGAGGEDGDGIIATELAGSKGQEDPGTKSQRLALTTAINAANQSESRLVAQRASTQSLLKANTDSKQRPALVAKIAELEGQLADVQRGKRELVERVVSLSAAAQTSNAPQYSTSARTVAEKVAAFRAMQR